MEREVMERFERIEAILENAGKRLDHASEIIDRMAPLIEETWTLTRENSKIVQAHLSSHEKPSPRHRHHEEAEMSDAIR